MQNGNQNTYGSPTDMTLGVQMIIFINVGVYILETFFGLPLRSWFALRANWLDTFSVWQLISYQFVHQGLMHLFSNMIGIYFLGPETERTIGTNRFIALYLVSGILGGLGWSLLAHPYHLCIGASGAVFGVLAAYAALYPNRELVIIFFPFMPVKAWIFVLILGAYEFFNTLNGQGGRIANSAHLSGGIAGYIYATITGRPDLIRRLKERFAPLDKDAFISRAEIDRVLDKAARHGIHSLTRSEREILRRANNQ